MCQVSYTKIFFIRIYSDICSCQNVHKRHTLFHMISHVFTYFQDSQEFLSDWTGTTNVLCFLCSRDFPCFHLVFNYHQHHHHHQHNQNPHGNVVGQHDDDDHSGSRCFVEAEQVAKSFLNLSQMLGLTSAPDIGLLSTIVIISITRPMPAFVRMGQG